MATFTKTAVLLALALCAGSVFAANKPAATQTISTLGGKFTFNLPKAYTADTLPTGKAEDGTADTQGTLYANSATKSVVIVAETVRNDGATIKDNDPQFLDGAVAGFVEDQSAALPDFKKQNEKKTDLQRPGPAPGGQHRHPGRRQDLELHVPGRFRQALAGDPGYFAGG